MKAMYQECDNLEKVELDVGVVSRMQVEDDSDPHFTIKKYLVALSYNARIAERLSILQELERNLLRLGITDIQYLKAWMGKRYDKIITLILRGLDSAEVVFEFTHMYRWGNDIIPRDNEFAGFLLNRYAPIGEVLENPSGYSKNIIYSHVNILSGKWTTASSKLVRTNAAVLAIPLLEYLMVDTGYLGARATYLLASAAVETNNKESAAKYYIENLLNKHALSHQRYLIFSIISGQMSEFRFPKDIESLILSDERILNSRFWEYFKSLVPGAKRFDELDVYINVLKGQGLTGDSHCPVNIQVETLLKDYLSFIICSENYSCDDLINIGERLLEHPDFISNRARDVHAKICVLKLINARQDFRGAFFHATQALTISYSADIALLLQQVFLAISEESIYSALCRIELCGSNKELSSALAESKLQKSYSEPVWITGDAITEIPLMVALLEMGEIPLLCELANARLATLYIRGECSPGKHLKIQHYQRGTQCLEHFGNNEYCMKLKSSLESFGFYRQQQSYIKNAGDSDYIFLEQPGSDELIIAFADRYSYHVFPSVPSLSKDRKTNVLFLNNPVCNWYSDEEVARIEGLIKELVLPRFNKNKVTCYHASMGGYAAIKFSSQFGFAAIAVNPQVNLDLWAVDRPDDAVRISGITRRINLDKLPAATYEGMAICLIVSRNPTDFLAFQAFFERLSSVKTLSIVIEKHSIAAHEGVIMKAYGSKVVEVVTDTSRRLELLKSLKTPNSDFSRILANNLYGVFNEIKDSCAGRWELLARDGVWYLFQEKHR
ncbi:hypothetical protein GVN18_09265 [Pseudomonas sp. ODNR1LW]|nr:hypothetical protein [Pseudomonas sp. ODNR1LW]